MNRHGLRHLWAASAVVLACGLAAAQEQPIASSGKGDAPAGVGLEARTVTGTDAPGKLCKERS